MTAVISKESKSILARLLATENITVEHRNVSTASFEPKSRVLTLPIWKNMSGDIYDLLCGHEVGHALYSPSLDEVPADLSKSWVNVVEDARIEKLMKRKFPGLSANFFRGYKEMFDRNFFETEGRDLNSYSLIDKINLHFKNVPLVPFNKTEQEFVDMVAECETFEDVINAVRSIREYAEEVEQEFEDIEEQDFNFDPDGEPTDIEEIQAEQKQQGEEEESTRNEGTPDYGDSVEDLEKKQEENVQTQSNTKNQSELEESETDNAWTRNQENLLDESCKNYIYLNIPDVDIDEIVVDWKHYSRVITAELIQVEENIKVKNYSNAVNITRNAYDKFKSSSMKSVNYLVKEFEMRKRADEYKRTAIAKTGVIDTNMLHSYKWNEDIFKKLSVTPGAKNHGLIFFLDWSGSMDVCLRNTVKQLYNLIWFCSKVQIPFEVYSFSEVDGRFRPFGNRQPVEKKINEIYINDGIRLHQMFTSEMKNIQLEDQMKKVWMLVHHHYQFSNWFSLGGTPLNEAIICSKQIAEKFQNRYKVQKLNFVYLTDGESNPLNYLIKNPRKSSYYSGEEFFPASPGGYYSSKGDVFVIRDNYRTYNIDRYSNYKQTETLLQWLKDNVNANVIGFRLANDREAHTCAYHFANLLWDAVKDQWKKNRSITLKKSGGYDELYIIKNDNQLGADAKEIEFDSDATKAQIRRAFATHMRSKQFNKVLLNKFIEAIA